MNPPALLLALGALYLGTAIAETTAPVTPENPENTAAAVTAPATPDKAALVTEAREAVMALGGTLKGELQAAMKAGGPVEAIAVCNIRAPEIASTVSAEKGLSIKRVSLKSRNPDTGVPNTWQQAVLEDFETRKAAGEAPDQLAYAEVVDQEFRFMKAIPTERLCLTCHGTGLATDISTKISELYPEDKATGYQEGDLRGAFVVVKTLAGQ
ncbi:MAG TPA: DUF3365 domain-containing protein [Thiolinea sp.]|nr:DUF3365 domain-containing protein [Thiolinea sp.]